MDCSLPDPSVHWILQARILEWVTISSSKGLSNPGIEPVSLPPALAGRFLTTSATWEALHPEYFALKKNRYQGNKSEGNLLCYKQMLNIFRDLLQVFIEKVIFPSAFKIGCYFKNMSHTQVSWNLAIIGKLLVFSLELILIFNFKSQRSNNFSPGNLLKFWDYMVFLWYRYFLIRIKEFSEASSGELKIKTF